MRAVLTTAVATIAIGATAGPALAAPTLSGTVWWDIDRSSLREPGEQAAPGVRVQLQRREGGRYVRIARTTTTPAGRWSFRLPGTGRYRARIVLPAMASEFSVRDAGSDARDSDVRQDNGVTPVVRGGPRAPSRRFDAGLYGLTIS